MSYPEKICVPLFVTIFIFLIISGLEAQGIFIDFGESNVTHYIQNVGNDVGSDGEIVIPEIDGEYCAQNAGTAMYFAIDDDRHFQKSAGVFNIINVEYFDASEREIKLIYDSQNDPDKEYHSVFKTAGSGTWKSTSFYLDDAYFSNRQKNNADFRLECADTMSINIVRVVPYDYYIDYGELNDEYFIIQKEIQGGDSKTEIIIQSGEECITGTLEDQYLYCDIDDEEIFEGNEPRLLVSVEYFDSDPLLTMRLQYDSENQPYKDTPWVQGKGWGSFKTYTWEISDAFFAGQQNGGSDFRIHMPEPGFLVNRITVGFLNEGAPNGVEDIQAKVSSFRLMQNYPNPFNPTTTIQYEVIQNGHVSLKIYNLTGELVRTLVNTEQAAGIYNQTWDGLDYNGKKLPSGLYIYRYITNDFVKSKKMMMLK